MSDDAKSGPSQIELRLNAVELRRGAFKLGPITTTFCPGASFIVGSNGAGKTTLFEVLLGLDTSATGLIERTPETLALGYLPQDPELPGRATCDQFLDYVCWLHKINRSERAAAIAKALTSVNLQSKHNSKISDLSGGMQRRLGIAQAIIHSPGVLLLDEPSAGLDPAQRIAFRGLIGDLATQRIVIVSTHLMDDVRSAADRILVLKDGSLAFDGTTRKILDLATDDAPGDTMLEKALSNLLGTEKIES